jgi:glycosyltransferase involved in cell wall biosynthesis
MMCVYNDITFLDKAVFSLIDQPFQDWELIVLDNSDEEHRNESWSKIQYFVIQDERIHGLRSEKNVGWAKGAAVCLAHVRGRYTTFLAADDLILEDSLSRLSEEMRQSEADVIWVGNEYISGRQEQQEEKVYEVYPEYCRYGESNKSQAIPELMRNVYYNSFFHYIRVEFLREQEIDFFEPYYADSVGMTKCMVSAKDMVVLDEVVYSLSLTTSQTMGYYIWDSYEFVFSLQWKLIRDVFLKENFQDKEEIQFAGNRICKNLVGQIGALCKSRCRDKYMNLLQKSDEEIIVQLEKILENDNVVELLVLGGTGGFSNLLKQVSYTAEMDETVYQDSWLAPLLYLSHDAGSMSSQQKIKYIVEFLLKTQNYACLGVHLLLEWIEESDDSVILQYEQQIRQILTKSNQYIYSLSGSILEHCIQ